MQPLLVRAARREPVERTPVWFMRQAGRSHPEYRALRGQPSFWEVAQTTELCAGAEVVQLFDSWVGVLSPADYEEFVAPWSARILASVDVPTIHFGTGTATLLPAMARAGGDVIGLDWRLPLAEGWALDGDAR